jgi:hypothetical protein
MFHKRSFKVLSNLALLLVLFTSQVAAASNLSVVAESSSISNLSIFPADKLLSVPARPKLNIQAAPGDTTRISDVAGGSSPSISKTGDYIAFESAGNIYYRDMNTSSSVLIGTGSRPSISANGLHVAYESSGHIYIYNRYPSGTSTLIDSGSTPSLSESGQYVAYEYFGSILVRDLFYNTIRIAFMASTESYGKIPSISGDGQRVAFVRTTTNAPTFPYGDILVRDLAEDASTVIYQSSFLPGSNGEDKFAWSPSISADGNYVAFKRYWNNYYPGADTFLVDFVLFNMQNSDEKVVTNYGASDWSSGDLYIPTTSISGDGRYVAYTRFTFTSSNIILYDTLMDEVTQVSMTPNSGVNPNGPSYSPSISSDGQVVAYASSASNLVVGDTNAATDVFLASNSEIVLTGIEVTQVVQDLNNSVTLIADKPTYVRAHVESKTVDINNVTVELSAYRNGVLLGTMRPSNLTSGFITVLKIPDRGKLDESFYFQIEKDWIIPGDLTFKITGAGHLVACSEPAVSGNVSDFSNDCEVDVTFEEGPIPDLRVYGVSWKSNLNQVHAPNKEDIKKALHQIKTTFPIRNFSWKDSGMYQSPFVYTSPYVLLNNEQMVNTSLHLSKYSSLNSRCRECFTVGVLVDYPSGGLTSGVGIGDTAISFLLDGLPINFGHEFGHISRDKNQPIPRGHTLCKKDQNNEYMEKWPINNAYPYSGGRISQEITGDNAFYGFNPSLIPASLMDELPNNNIGEDMIYTPLTGDMMSYCDIVWPSDYTYEDILESLKSRWPINAPAQSLQTQPSILVSGFVDNTQGTGNLDSLYTFESVPVIPESGSYTIRFEDSANQEIDSYSFEPDIDNETDSSLGGFNLILPKPNNADHIVLLHENNIVDARVASSSPPVVSNISPNGGEILSGTTATISWTASDIDNDTLVYAVQYSRDNGSTWETLAVDWPNSTLDINPSSLAGTDVGLIRVLASDGFYTTEGQSDAVFSVAKHEPEVEIDTHYEAVFSGNQTVTLEGSSYDMEDGQLPSTSLEWSSNLDGSLGQGESISINAQQLTEGTHMITLTAQDSDLQTGSATITIHVYRSFSSLSVETTPLEFTVSDGNVRTFEQIVPVWHLGNHSLTWSATADQNWIVLTQIGTDTPSDLAVSADPTGLSVGTYTGTITITSNAEGITSQTVPVTLEVQTPPAPPPSWNTFLGGSGNDSSHTIVQDADGNTYVSGVSNMSWGNPLQAYAGGELSGDDVYVAKLDPAGNLLWNTFLGSANIEIEGHGLAVDENGNVYITGGADGSWGTPVHPFGGQRDTFVAKLDSNGVLLWHTYLGGVDGVDAGKGITVHDGTIYMTGTSDAAWGWGVPLAAYSSGVDGFLASLNATNGNLNWHTFFGGSGAEIAYGVKRDAAGNLYVSGYASETWGNPVRAHVPGGGDNDGMMVKFNSSGVLLWNTFLGGSGFDIVNNLDIGSTGDLYLAGRSVVGWGDPLSAYAGGSQDGFVARMDPTTGALLWHSFIGGNGADYAWGVVVDESDNINVVGSSDTGWGSPLTAFSSGYDGFYAKFTPSGGLLLNTFMGGSGADRAYSLDLDNENKVYITGYSNDTWGDPVRPYSAGNDNFVTKVTIDSPPLIVSSVTRNAASPTNASSVSYTVNFSEPVTGVDVSDFTLETMDLTGTGIGGVSGSGATYTVTVNTGSGDGTIRLDVLDDDTIINSASEPLAAGFTTGQTYFIDRNTPWNTFLGGNGNDLGYSVVRDAAGYIYVSGSSSETWGSPLQPFSGAASNGDDVYVAKLTPGGNLIWNTFLGASDLDRYGYDMTLDEEGNVYVTGFSQETWGNPQRAFSGSRAAFVAKLDSSGDLIWNTFLGGGDGAQGDGIDYRAGVIYVTGTSNTTWDTPINAYTAGNDSFLATLDASTGVLNWHTFFGGSSEDLGYVLNVDGSGNSYISGYGGGTWGSPVRAYTAGPSDGFLVKFDPAGNMVWNTFLGGSGDDTAYRFDLDANGNIYLVGRSTLTWGDPISGFSGGARDGYVTKIDSSTGELLWSSFVGGSGDDFIWNLNLDANGNIKISGASDTTWGSPVTAHAGGFDAFYAKLDPSGGLLGNTFLGGTGIDKAYGMLLGSAESAYLFGYSDATWGTPVRAYSAGNDNFAAKVNLENLPLIVSSATRNAASPTNAASVSYTVSFSEPVTGVDTSDFTLTTTGVTGAMINGVSGSGAVYTVTVNTGTGSGTIRLNVADDNSIVNAASNNLAAGFTIGQIYAVDKTVPTVSSSVRNATSPAESTVSFIVTFSEAVSGVELSDFSLTTTGVTGASLVGVTGSGSVYTVAVNTGAGSGTIRLNVVDDDSIMDAAGNRLGGTGAGNGAYIAGQTYTITSLTVNSAAAQDGWILESAENSSIGGGTPDSTALTFVLGDNVANRQYRTILHFNTSTLPDTAVITSSTLKIKYSGTITGTDPFTTHGGLLVDIQKPYFGSAAALAVEDFQAAAGQAGVGTFGSAAVSNWYTAILTSAGFPEVNLTGNTQLRLFFTLDDNNDAGQDTMSFYSGNHGTVANRPQFIIQYFVP